MSRSVIDIIADAMAKADPHADPLVNGDEFYKGLLIAGLAGARSELTALRGDPRGYGQGFHDPLGPSIYHIDVLLSDKPVD